MANPGSRHSQRSRLWCVCGGQDKGGILVRHGAGLEAPLYSERLSSDALVRELCLEGHRLQYRLVNGAGPLEGWVSIRIKEAVLLKPFEQKETPAKFDSTDATRAAGPAIFKPRIYSSKDLAKNRTEINVGWSPLEKALFYQSCGRWDPDQLRSLRLGPAKWAGPSMVPKPKKVSVLTPTSHTRAKFHQQLWTCFDAQSWTDKELVIIDSSQGSPSSFFFELVSPA